jgi:ABC-type Fe3+/spermidine/putrescine transport system ATPase subunit
MTDQSSPILEIRDASRRFGPVIALDDVSLSVPRGQFLTLLGPSGSGKTTLLRIIAGLETPTAVAELRIAGIDVRGIPANHRNVATVFQHYGLFPHMSVGENIEYGLRVRGWQADRRRKRALEALDLVRLPEMYARRVHQLSGGERQRVALARAIVTEPEILLLDEPLGALDERLRQDMQVELLRLQKSLEMTFILVTHSQEEALTMSQRVVLLNRGRIVQDGPPQALFEKPARKFVAKFMGVENVLEGTVTGVDDGAARIAVGNIGLSGGLVPGARLAPGDPGFLAVRADRISLLPDRAAAGAADNGLACRPGLRIYKGNYYEIELKTALGTIICRQWEPAHSAQGEYAAWRSEDCVIGPDDPQSV